MAIQIKKYRVDRWLNTKTGQALFGVSVQIEGKRGWVRVADENKAVILETMTEARVYIESMKAERDADGFKKAQ